MNNYCEVLTLSGDLDIADRASLEKRFEGLGRASVLIVDLSEVTYLDSSTLGVFISAWNRRKYTPGSMFFLPPRSTLVQRIFTLTGLDRVLPFAPEETKGFFLHSRQA